MGSLALQKKTRRRFEISWIKRMGNSHVTYAKIGEIHFSFSEKRKIGEIKKNRGFY